MNKLISFLIIIVFQVSFLAAQTIDWCPPGAKWTIGHLGSGYEGYYLHEYTGDTILSGITCKIIRETSKIFYYWNPTQYTYGGPTYWYTYEDSGAVYFRLPADTAFYLLYNFNTPVGGKWAVRDMYSGLVTDSVVVDSIGNEIINGDTLQCMWVVNDTGDCLNYLTYWYGPQHTQSRGKICERTGNRGYLFPEEICSVLEYSYVLRCYQNNEIGLYSTGVSDSCNQIPPLMTSRDDNNFQSQVDVYPNPAGKDLHIEMDKTGNFRAEIFSVDGRMLASAEFDGMTRIDISRLEAGLYMLIITAPDGAVARKKFLKAE